MFGRLARKDMMNVQKLSKSNLFGLGTKIFCEIQRYRQFFPIFGLPSQQIIKLHPFFGYGCEISSSFPGLSGSLGSIN